MIIGIKTSNGETVMGEKLEQMGSDAITLEDPFSIMIAPTGQGSYGIGLAPYISFAEDKKFTFGREHILHTFTPSAELKNEYQRLTGRGIVVPDSGIKVVK
jgi:hypothetical protein